MHSCSVSIRSACKSSLLGRQLPKLSDLIKCNASSQTATLRLDARAALDELKIVKAAGQLDGNTSAGFRVGVYLLRTTLIIIGASINVLYLYIYTCIYYFPRAVTKTQFLL